jgi:predicted permease
MIELIRRIRYWLRHRGSDEALREEMEFHLAMKQRELEHDGMPAGDARLAARREMGNLTRAREDARALRVGPWIDSVRQDATYAVRSLRRHPGFTLASLAVLGVAIGLNTSLFTVFAGLALRPMAGMTDPGRVVSVSAVSPIGRGGAMGLSFPEFRALAHAKGIEGLAASRPAQVALESQGASRTTTVYLVTGNYFDVLGVRMAHGRGFRAEEDRLGAPQRVVVLGHQLWQARFGGRPGIVGETVSVNGVPHTVVGIVSPEFTGPEGASNRIWLPLSLLPLLRPDDPFTAGLLDRWQDCCVDVLGRLAAGVGRRESQAELQVLSSRFRASVGQSDRPLLVGGTQFLGGRRASAEALAVTGVLFIGLILVLLIACANVGNLLVARAAAGAAGLGARLSLGADRRRVVRQLLTEGFVLAAAASALGLLLAWWLPPAVLRTVAGNAAPFDITPDLLVLGYAVALAAVSCLAFALAPALHATRADVLTALKGGMPERRSRFPLRSVLLAVQVAVTVVLLMSAGLLLRGVAQARQMDLGFAIDEVAVARVALPAEAYDRVRAQAFLAELTAALRAAGVDTFAVASNEPLGDGSSRTGIRRPDEGDDRAQTIEYVEVSPGYFGMLRVPLVAGRDFDERDSGRPVAILNESAARRLLPGESAVGRSLVSGSRSIEIVGVARDAYTGDLDGIEPMMFQPLTGPARADFFPKILLPTADRSAASQVTSIVGRLDARALVDVTPLADRLDDQLQGLSFAPLAASALGLFGLAIATVGLFGVFAYSVQQRTREIGIRMALGARSGDVARLVLARSSRAVLAGLGAGLLGAIAAAQVLRSSLYGLSPLDPIAYGGVMLLLTLAAIAASYLPVRRATRLDPTQALRTE